MNRYSIGFFNQARKSANMQGPLKSYPPIVRLILFLLPRRAQSLIFASLPAPPFSSLLTLSHSHSHTLSSPHSLDLSLPHPLDCSLTSQTGAEFIAQAMQRNYQAALDKAKLQTYEISKETLEANKDYVVSGTGVGRKVVAVAA